MRITEIERTGTVTRVWVAVDGVTDDTAWFAERFAASRVGLIPSETVVHPADLTVEVLFT